MKRLYRSRKDKMLAGVAGGLAEYFDVDPVLTRIIFVVTAIISGIGLIAYVLLWIIVPQNPGQLQEYYKKSYPDAAGQSEGIKNPEGTSGEQSGDQSGAENSTKAKGSEYFNSGEAGSEEIPENKKDKSVIAGSILVVIGLLFLADNFLPFFRFSDFWPIVLVALGIGLILKNK